MKKLFYMISTVAFVASFASCNKMEQENIPATDDTIVETPAVGETTTITVSSGMQQTKVILRDDEGVKKTFWSASDVVTLLGRNDASATATADFTAAVNDFTFTGWPANVEPEYLVFNGPLASTEENYGGNKVMAPVYDTKDGAITAEVRQKQEITNKSNMSKYANLSVGKVESGENGVFSAEMKNVCGLIKFVFANETTVATSVVIENSGDNFMTGKVKVNYNNGEPTVTEVIEGNKSVEVTSHISNTDDKLLKGSYYACVLPGTYAPKITINLAEGDPIVLQAPEGTTITVNRNEIFDFGEIDNIKPDAGEDPVEPTPTETKTLTIDFSTSWPFSPTLAKGSTSNVVKDKTSYTFTQDGVDYPIEIWAPSAGYYNTGSALRFQGTGGGYITTPAIQDYKLTDITINVTNAMTTNSSNKTISMYKEVTVNQDQNDVWSVGTAIIEMKINLRDTTTGSWSSITGTEANASYYLFTESNHYQLGKLVLTYTKAN